MIEQPYLDEKEWTHQQVEGYRRRYPNYLLFAEVIDKILQKAAKKLAPLAIVQTRPKGISNFAEKCQRKKNQSKDPVNQFTDLCGGRIIVHTAEQVETISRFIEDHFEIDRENTIDVRERLKATEFGYRSIHYIISFKKGVFPTEDVDVTVPAILYDDQQFPNRRAEIQVRTILEHAWADVAHALVYKSPFKVPAKWEREFAGVAAMLENVDTTFSRVKEGLSAYASNYGSYMSKEQMEEKIQSLEIVMEHDPENPKLADQVARLAMTLGNWDKAVNVLSKHVDSGDPAVLVDLGVAMCRMHQKIPKSRKYKQGQRFLETACAPESANIDALACLAETYKGVDDEKARDLYHRAFQLDTTNPFPLENYLDLEIALSKDASVISPLTPVIHKAIQRCRDQAEVGVNLPQVFYTMGKFYLLLGEPYAALESYTKAVQLSPAPYMIESALDSLEHLKDIAADLEGFEWMRRFLLVSWAVQTEKKLQEIEQTDVQSQTDNKIRELARRARAAAKTVKDLAVCRKKPIKTPVVILAGGCDSTVEEQMNAYRETVLTAFKDFEGTVIGGGTKEGASGLVGNLAEKYPDKIRTIGYLPKLIPTTAHKDLRYTEIYETDGSDFSPMEPLQNWIDLIAAGIDPATVKLLGINGGSIAEIEFRIALALGATVGLIANSGRAVSLLIRDKKWFGSSRLIQLPSDVMTIRAFIGSAEPKLDEAIREILAKEIHGIYRQNKQDIIKSDDPSMNIWDNLDAVFKNSSARQADDIYNKLREIGCTVHKVTDRNIELFEFSQAEIELLAENEHGRWNAERLLEGWTLGEEKSTAKKTSPYLVSWVDLPEDIREWDRMAVRNIPNLLAAVDLEIRRD